MPQVCKKCWRAFRLPSDLRQHMLTHTDEKPYQCKPCGLKFYRQGGLRKHVQLEHAKGAVFKCPACTMKFSRSTDLLKHKQWHLGRAKTAIDDSKQPSRIVKNYACKFCEWKFAASQELDVHVRRRHSRTKAKEWSVSSANESLKETEPESDIDETSELITEAVIYALNVKKPDASLGPGTPAQAQAASQNDIEAAVGSNATDLCWSEQEPLADDVVEVSAAVLRDLTSRANALVQLATTRDKDESLKELAQKQKQFLEAIQRVAVG